MAKGGGGGSTTTVQKSDPWAGQQPFLNTGFSNADALFQQGKLSPQLYQGNQIAPTSDITNQAISLQTNRAMNGSPLQNSANAEATHTLNGDYLNANPYLTGALQSGFDDASKAYYQTIGQNNSGFEQAGRYGSGLQKFANGQANDALAKNMTNAAANAYAGNYANERTNQQRAVALAPTLAQEDYRNLDALTNVGSYLDNRAQDQLTSQVNLYNQNAMQPANNLQAYLNLIQGNYGSSGSSTQTGTQAGSNRISSALGGAAAGASIGGPWGAAIGGAGGLLGLF